MINMKSLIENIVPGVLVNFLQRIRHFRGYWLWKINGRPIPLPHLAKQNIINGYKKMYGADVLVETGTYLGETIQSQLNGFKKIISVEVATHLYQRAVRRFKKYSHVRIFNGDSGEVLKVIVPTLPSISIFWLDGHYSGGVTGRGKLDSPIKEELQTIFKSQYAHIILIDDSRLFDGTNGYPKLSELEGWVAAEGKYACTVEDDIIRLTPCRKD